MEERERKLRADVKEFGWHVVCVPEDQEGPSFAYSVGLTKTFNHPEIVFLGLDLKLMNTIINDIGDRIKSGERFLSGLRYQEILRSYDCLFQQVEERYFSDYFGQAIDFYGGHNFQVLQCLWPDKNGVFPLDRDYAEGIQVKQTLTTSTDRPDVESAKVTNNHTHRFQKSEWPFKALDNAVAFTTAPVVRDNRPVLIVSHDEEGDWQFLCGTTYETADLLVVCLGCAFDRDRSVGQVADLPVGWQAIRESKDSPWERIPPDH